MYLNAGPGESEYTWYDREITARAPGVAARTGAEASRNAWVLFVSLVAPHFPLKAPPHWYYRYPLEKLPLPTLYARHERPDHPHVRDQAANLRYDEYFRDEESVKRAIAGYLGLVSSLDENIGHILDCLEDTGLSRSTRVLYTSDHGDNLGARGLWGKSMLYEDPTRVPMVLARPDVPQGEARALPVSHIDVYSMVLQCVGADSPEMYDGQPGISLLELARGRTIERTVLSEYHAMASRAGEYIIRHGRWKYVYFVAYPGGWEAIRAKGGFGYSPPPGFKPDFT
jgi:choline-sulfatase